MGDRSGSTAGEEPLFLLSGVRMNGTPGLSVQPGVSWRTIGGHLELVASHYGIRRGICHLVDLDSEEEFIFYASYSEQKATPQASTDQRGYEAQLSFLVEIGSEAAAPRSETVPRLGEAL